MKHELSGWANIEVQWRVPFRKGQMIGERKDGAFFYLNLLSPDHRFTEQVELRAIRILNTFTICDCEPGEPCFYHQAFCPQTVGVPDYPEGENQCPHTI